MRTIRLTTLLLLLLLMNFSGCTREVEQSRGLEQIHQEEGLPVKTVVVQAAPFSTWMLFNATMQGIEQTNTTAGIGARVVEVRAAVGDRVSEDQVIVTFPTDNPMAHYEQSRVAFNNATAALERLEGLITGGGISQQDLDNARLQYDLAAANWDVARKTVEKEAPISGFVTSLSVSPSDNVGPDDQLFTIARTDIMRSRIWLSEEEFLQVQIGASALLQWQGMEFEGSLVHLDQSLNRDHGGFGATVQFSNPDNLLKPGITAELRILTYYNPDAVQLSFPHLVNNPAGGKAVYLADGEQARLTAVTTGRQQGLQLEITGGLQIGDQLITTGQQMLEDGLRIKLLTGEE
jgi:membrane fusion protein, multidrug efflux system